VLNFLPRVIFIGFRIFLHPSIMRIIALFLFLSTSVIAKAPVLDSESLKNPPPRIIRTCCSFGVDVKVAGMPFVKVTDVTGMEKIGSHKYLGSKEEQNGIIYTQHGGFIDMGHLRDMADFTGYLYNLIISVKANPNFTLKLGNEGGQKTLSFNIPENISEIDAVNLAGKIAYDISVWHEISTWYGASYIPLVPERYSSFSIEDAYSNLMGVHLGMKAILSKADYETAMTSQVTEMLQHLGAVQDMEATKAAMNSVRDIWWSGKAKLPSRKVLMKRQYEMYGCICPLLIDDVEVSKDDDFILCVPSNTQMGQQLNDLYVLGIKTNYKIPIKKIFGEHIKQKNITQLDFPALINYAAASSVKEVFN
jgi:Protein of unknown function (DUF4056)